MVDFHVSPTGNDAADGLTQATAWKTLGKLLAVPANSKAILYGGGVIANGATSFQKALQLTTPPGVQAQIKGSGKISLDIQNWQGGSILPGAGGRITILPPSGFTETTGADGEKAGAVLGRGLSIYQCADMQVDVFVVAGTDYGLYLRDTVRSRIVADVSDAGEAFHLQGNLGTGNDRTWVGGYAHDCHRMIRNTKPVGTTKKNDDYGATGFVFTRSTGGGLLAGWKAEGCFAPSFDYKADGGGLVHDDATDSIVQPGTIKDCEGGYEDGGTQGGNHRNVIEKLSILGNIGIGTGALGLSARSPGVLIRNNEAGTFEFYLDITRARVAFEMGADGGTFGGPIDNTRVTGSIVQRPGVPTGLPIGGLPASTTVNFVVTQPGPPPPDPCATIKVERDALKTDLATANTAIVELQAKLDAIPPAPTWTFGAVENATFTLPGLRLVRYGKTGKYNYKILSGLVKADNLTFGDPLVGTVKQADYIGIPAG